MAQCIIQNILYIYYPVSKYNTCVVAQENNNNTFGKECSMVQFIFEIESKQYIYQYFKYRTV